MIRGMRMASSVRLVTPHSPVNIRFSWSCVIRQKMRVREGRQRTYPKSTKSGKTETVAR